MFIDNKQYARTTIDKSYPQGKYSTPVLYFSQWEKIKLKKTFQLKWQFQPINK